ncbi:hypothetical protein AKJ66_03070 [candidate division MSBL1 archaeon SCGC-AAA259E22]|uniref:tRNA (guanine(26)-N(2))-dimethyltransferase n=1 Tax=candidate division MSBL1 archaeon SCGC-AAA259E22 TaxID=1698265 RepID=A0A133UFI4_9EURY|nr:hypothetical protein AKJ66_03070 [candidate division MSBL1 archaeon SCGC-AAA259E22]
METQIVEEGKIKLEVPRLEDYRTSPKEYVPSQTPVFFNPVMEISRDLSVSSLQVLSEEIENLRICDALAGVGARGLRYLAEVDGVGKLLINDWNSEAADFIRRNIENNDLSGVEVRNEDANTLLHNYRPRFHVIDIDPFGTPIPFLDSSFSAISRRGIFLVTATDTGPLCGAYQNACLRKYGSWPLRTPYSRELGLRILIGSVQRRAAVYDLALSPVLSHATQHFFRAHFQVAQGAKKADRVVKKQGYFSHCFDCGRRSVKGGLSPTLPERCECGRTLEHAGPLWTDKLADEDHLQKVVEDLSARDFKLMNKERKLLNLCIAEVDGPPGFYDLHELSSRANVSPPKIETFIRQLRENEYFASRTHFSDTGIRTDASMDFLIDLITDGN